MNIKKEYDLLIVGAGIYGATTAYSWNTNLWQTKRRASLSEDDWLNTSITIWLLLSRKSWDS